jgi:hypothetical protein
MAQFSAIDLLFCKLEQLANLLTNMLADSLTDMLADLLKNMVDES